jgi:hypothetical protein
MAERVKTMSEQLLERYLKEHRLGDFEYKPEGSPAN